MWLPWTSFPSSPIQPGTVRSLNLGFSLMRFTASLGKHCDIKTPLNWFSITRERVDLWGIPHYKAGLHTHPINTDWNQLQKKENHCNSVCLPLPISYTNPHLKPAKLTRMINIFLGTMTRSESSLEVVQIICSWSYRLAIFSILFLKRFGWNQDPHQLTSPEPTPIDC